MNVFQTSSSLSELMPTSWKDFPAYFLCRSRRMGTDSRQGGHQVPQKSTRTTLPRREALETGWFWEVVKKKSGANGARARKGFAIIFLASATVSESAPGKETKAFSSAMPS